jgi:hypothetical protein
MTDIAVASAQTAVDNIQRLRNVAVNHRRNATHGCPTGTSLNPTVFVFHSGFSFKSDPST